jgi:hypothetical protein
MVHGLAFQTRLMSCNQHDGRMSAFHPIRTLGRA